MPEWLRARLIIENTLVQFQLCAPISNVREATVGCVAADCNPAHQKHRWFDSNRVHQFFEQRELGK